MNHQHIPGDPDLERALRRAIEGEVRFDALSRGLYSTDASHYQIEPLGVVFPKTTADVAAIIQVAAERGVPVLPRGGGTSQCGQTVGRSVVVDVSRHLTDIGEADGSRIEVEPGVVLDHLNRRLAPTGNWFPVDPSTGSRATLGGMAGNNSAGSRSLQYGMMVDNVLAVEAILPDGRTVWLGEGGNEATLMPGELHRLRSLYSQNADEILRRTPGTMRNVAGYNVDRLAPESENLGRLLVGSEGTLAFFTRLKLGLKPLPQTRVLGVCHFSGLVDALDAVQHLVPLRPSAIELVDENILSLALGHPDFRAATSRFVRGSPAALLLVEFSHPESNADLGGQLADLEDRLASLGHPNSVVRVERPELQADVWTVRKAGLNIVMSMAGPRKPISFIEDCAVPLEHLAEYAQSVNRIFARHGAAGTWYAHASVGCLHVRPALNLRDPADVGHMRAIAEEVHEVVRTMGGTHSGEHGDGLLRSEFLESMLGRRMTALYADVKRTFDPGGMMNPGKIVDPPRMDDRSLFRYRPGYRDRALPVALDWSADRTYLGALEKCNSNGACRKSDPGVMCPSFRATQDERHSTRGRANALRLAVTGQLGDEGLNSSEMAEAMSLCLSCKACKRECPTGVDMARLKLEWQHHKNGQTGIPLRERMLGALPRIAPLVSFAAPVANVMGRIPGMKRMAGLAAARPLPRWSRQPWSDSELSHRCPPGAADSTRPEAVLFVDTFTRWFEPENARAAATILAAGGWPTTAPRGGGVRPLCCGRTYLSAGMLDSARAEAERLVAALAPAARRGAWIVGLEPSCLLTLRDEIPGLVPGSDSDVVARQAVLLEEFLDQAWERGEEVPFDAAPEPTTLLVHGHCHQKALGAPASTRRMLERIPNVSVDEVQAGCCGMAGAFGYHAEHYDVSVRIGEMELLPAVRAAHPDQRVVADGTSCRAQIQDNTDREACHAAIVLRDALS